MAEALSRALSHAGRRVIFRNSPATGQDMPDCLKVGSVFWSVIRFPESEIEVDKNSQLQQPRLLELRIFIDLDFRFRKTNNAPENGSDLKTVRHILACGWRIPKNHAATGV